MMLRLSIDDFTSFPMLPVLVPTPDKDQAGPSRQNKAAKKIDSQLNISFAGQARIYEYDLVVFGGCAGGISCAKEAVAQGATNVAVLDCKQDENIKWGAGGTCINAGCVPIKILNHAAFLGETFKVGLSLFL